MGNSKLFVGNLNYATTEPELQELFASYGTVKSVKIIPNKGFGFVEMASSEEAAAAQSGLNETNQGGRDIHVNEARPEKDRPKRDNFKRF